MFCKQCGTKNEENYKFCSNCGGGNDVAATPQTQQTAKSEKSTKKYAILGLCVLVAVVAAVLFLTVFSGGELQGTWVLQGERHPKYPTTIEFSGNRFTVQQYLHWWESDQRLGQVNTSTYASWRSRFDTSNELRENSQHIGTIRINLAFGGFVMNQLYRATTSSGTYSVSGDMLELVFSDGRISTYTIQRTENTLQISGWRFIRR